MKKLLLLLSVLLAGGVSGAWAGPTAVNYEDIKAGYYALFNQSGTLTKRYLGYDMKGAGSAQTAAVFYIAPVAGEEGYYTLQLVATGKYLKWASGAPVMTASTTSTTVVIDGTDATSNQCKWKITGTSGSSTIKFWPKGYEDSRVLIQWGSYTTDYCGLYGTTTYHGANWAIMPCEEIDYHAVMGGTDIFSSGSYVVKGETPYLPYSSLLHNPFVSFGNKFYSNVGLSSEVSEITAGTDLYVSANSTAPFDFSTEGSPKYYYIYSHEQVSTSTSDYFLYNNSGAYNSSFVLTDGAVPYSDTKYLWAFIGNPYELKLKNKAGGYLAAKTLTAASNGTAVASKITTADDAEYPYQTYRLYGYNQGNNTVPTVNPFALTLIGSNLKTWVDGATTNKIIYHGNITVNSSLEINNWRTANLMVEDHLFYSIKLNSDGNHAYATTYLPFPIKMATGVKAYKAVSTGTNTQNLSKVADAALTEDEGDVLAAGTAAILWKEGATETATIQFNVVTSSKAAPGDNLLSGTDVAASVPGGKSAYVLYGGANGVGFYPLEGTDLPLYKAYYLEASGVKSFSFNFNDIVDGIEAAKQKEIMSQGDLYDLSGRLVVKPTRGLYITKGQKFVK